jgi:hypothetical protein
MRSLLVAAGVNLGYSLTWIIGYLANHPEMQERAYEELQKVYKGAVPEPYDFDRVEYVKALHMVMFNAQISNSPLTPNI